jgi:hypothetical protein
MQALSTPSQAGAIGHRAPRGARCGLACGLVLLAAGVACNGEEDGGGTAACLEPLPLDCEVAFPPTYQAIYDNVIAARCGITGTGGSCHGPEGMQGGLSLAGEDEAYDALLGEVDGKARVVPGEPECSELLRRVESDDRNFRMPLGDRKLPDTTLCAIRQWIAEGAIRDGTD